MNFDSLLLKKMSDCYSPSGREEKIGQLILKEIEDYVDEAKFDRLGNLIARKKGSGRRVMLAAHMDQLGLIVTDIEQNGLLKVAFVGSMKPVRLINQRVVFANGMEGVVCVERLEADKSCTVKNLRVDIMADSYEDAKAKVKVGDMCVYQTSFYENDNYVMCKSLDDKIGCYILIEAIKRQKATDSDMYYVFTVQEEVGCRGAVTAGQQINPDICVAVDIGRSGDDIDGYPSSVTAGKGPAIKLMDIGLITHLEIMDMLIDICEKKDIMYQLEAVDSGGTDAGGVHKANGGVACGTISIPTRYGHSSSEVIHKKDVMEAIRMIAEIE